MTDERDDLDDENFADSHRDDRLPRRDDGLNGEVESEEDRLDEEVEQTFPASDPPVVTRRSGSDTPGAADEDDD